MVRRSATVSQAISPTVGGAVRVPTPSRAANPEADGVLFARQSPLMTVETTGPRSISMGKESAYTVAITNAGEFAA